MKNVFIVSPTNKTKEEFNKDYSNSRRFLREKFPNETLNVTNSLKTEMVQVPNEKSDRDKLLYISEVLQQYIADADLVLFESGWEEYRGYRLLHTCCVEYGIDFIEM